MGEILSASELSIAFPEGRAVDGLNFAIKSGQTYALLGESGCGKSMTALAFLQLLPAAARFVAQSRLNLQEENLLTFSEVFMRSIRGRRIAMIFQDPMLALNPVMTTGQQIAEVLRYHFSMPKQQARQRALELLNAVGIADAALRLDSYPHQLSGGMRQRIMIAIALAAEPEVLIADEPTTALDVTIQAQILQLLQSLQRQKQMTILLITHDLAVVKMMADEVGVMYAGHIVEQAPASEFFQSPKHPYSQQLFASLPSLEQRQQPLSVIKGVVPALGETLAPCRFANRCLYAWDSCRTHTPKWLKVASAHKSNVHQVSVHQANVHQIRCHLYDKAYQSTAPCSKTMTAAAKVVETTTEKFVKSPKSILTKGMDATAEPLLKIENLCVHFPITKGIFKRTAGYVRAVDGVDFIIKPGKTLAIVGESGCGKSTIAQTLVRLYNPTAGNIYYQGRDIAQLSRKELQTMRRDIQLIFQSSQAAMNPRILLADILEEGMLALGVGKNRQQRKKSMHKLLEQVGLPLDSLNRYPHEFSGGQQQRLGIARALAVQPKIVICDEPTSALDVSVQAQILNLLKELQQQLNLSYLFITHNIAVVSYLADEVAVMYLGRIVESGPVERILTDPKHPYTQSLLASVPEINRPNLLEKADAFGEYPSPSSPPTGCHFHPRCPHAMKKCSQSYPGSTELKGGQRVKCFLYS